MIRVYIQNFQAIDKASIEIDGFTALVGRSNIGKSAVIRAISGAISNEQGTKFVRHGLDCLRRTKGVKTCKCFASVHIQAPGLDLLWEKGDTVGRYVVNGTTYEALGKGFPDFLKPWFEPVEIGNTSSVLQVSDQFDPIFLLGEPGSVVADVLSDVTQLNSVNIAMRLVEKDRRDALAVLKVREKDAKGLQDRLAGYVGLEAVLLKAASIEHALVSLEALEKAVAQVDSFLVRVTSVALIVRQLMGVETVEPPGSSGLIEITSSVRLLGRLFEAWSEKTNAVKVLESVDAIDTPIAKVCSTEVLGKLSDFQERWESKTRLVQALKLSEDVCCPVLPELKLAFSKVLKLHDWLDRLREFKVVLDDLISMRGLVVPDEHRLYWDAGKDRLSSKYASLVDEVFRLEESLQATEKVVLQVTKDLSEIDCCPLCGRSLDGIDFCIQDGHTSSGSVSGIMEG